MARAAAGLVVLAQVLGAQDWSAEKEAALGRAMAEDHRRANPVVNDTLLVPYLTGLARRLAPDGAVVRLELTRDLETREATPLPDGYLFVPLGALTAAATESALAGVIAHGLAHADLGHLRPRKLGPLGGIPLVFPLHGPSVLVPLSWAPQQRRHENDAERRAAGSLSRAGFDPREYAAFVETLPASAVSNPGERLAEIRAAPLPVEAFASGEFDAVRVRALELATRLAPASRGRHQPPTLRRNR